MRTGTDLSGELLDGRFRVESTAGRGRFGTVFHGRDQTRGVACAVRVLGVPPPLPAAGASAAESLRAALRECVLRGHKLGQKTGAMVKTFGFAVPPVPANAAGAGIAYVASAWLDGESLAASLDRRRIEGLTGRSAADVLAALGPVAEAVAILHDLGGVHGGLHPHAIRLVTLGRTQEPRLLDAGLETVLLGANGGASRGPWHAETDPYLAPEQLSPSLGDPSPRTDVYSLALLVLELLADRPPIPLAGERETREQVLDPLGRPTPGVLSIDVEPVVADVLARAVSLEPLARFRDGNTFWTTLKAAVERAVQMPRPSRLSLARANDTIQMSGGSLPSVRSLDALLEAVAVEPPPRESEPFGRAEWRSSHGDDSGNDDLREGSFSEEELPQDEDSYDEDEDEDESGNDLAPRTPSTSRIPAGALPALPAGQIPAAPPSLSVAPARWSGAARNGAAPGAQRSRLSLFLGLGAGAAIGVALFAYLLGGPSSASPTLPLVDAAPPAASAVMAPPFDGKLAAGVLAAVDARIPNCRSAVGPSGKGTVHLTFAPDGTVSNVTLDPPYAGTSRGVCVAGLFRTPRVPPFSGSPDPLAHTFGF